MDKEKVISGLRSIKTYLASQAIETTDSFARELFIESQKDIDDAIALLKEQEEQKRRWLQCIADNQLAYAPSERDDAYCYAKHQGIHDGLQMAWEILTEEK